MAPEKLILSRLPKTWILDLDGTLLKHNGYLLDREDHLLEGSKDFIDSIPEEDFILILTARTENYKEMTIEFLKKNSIRYDDIIFGIPTGERILINDDKPGGLKTAYSINLKRDEGISLETENIL